MSRRLAAECALLLLLAVACAWASNALAGPARHLSWFPRAVRALPVPPPAAPPAEKPAEPPPAAPAGPVAKKATVAAAAPKPDPAAELLARFPPPSDTPQVEIGFADALWLHAHGAAFIDARRTSAWAQGHIRGAKVISIWEDGLAEKVEELSMFSKDLKLPVVLYCSGGDCQDSHLLAQKLWVAGFRNLLIYKGGYPDWEAQRGPVAKEARP